MYNFRLTTFFILALLSCQYSWATEPDAREILNQQRVLHDAPFESSSVIIILVDRKGKTKKRVIRSYKKTMADKLSRSLTIFTEPANLKGTSILSVETAPNQVSQWIYLPATKSMQRVAANTRTDYFMGTDLTYEDLDTDNLDDYQMVITGSETIDNQDCWIIEVVPANDNIRKTSGYSKRIMYVRKDINFTVKVEFFGRRGRKTKTQTNIELNNVRGNMWVAKKSIIDNSRMHHKTMLGLVSLDLDKEQDDEIFTERFVSSGRLPK